MSNGLEPQRDSEEISAFAYNQMYARDGRSLWDFVDTHLDHKLGKPHQVHAKSDIQRTLDVVEKAKNEAGGKLDVVGVSEVLGDLQADPLTGGLKELGFESVHEGKGHGWKGVDDQFVTTLLATRAQSHQLHIPGLKNLPRALGNGGGMVRAVIPDLGNTHVLQAHLPLHGGKEGRPEFHRQLGILSNQAQQVSEDSNLIMLGDFNIPPEQLIELVRKGHPNLAERLRLLSPNVATCSEVPLIGRFYKKCVDYVLGAGYEAETAEARLVKGASDHLGAFTKVRRLKKV